MKIKKMCAIRRDDIENELEHILELTYKAKHLCKKCLRVSNDKSVLCKPVKIKK